jgi:PAS domain S-box-containing protein
VNRAVEHHSSMPVQFVGPNSRTETAIELTSSDMDQRRTLEQALRDLSDQKFALDQHAEVSMSDVEGQITYVNDRFCTLTQYSQKELIGQNHRIINSGFHSKEFFRKLYETIARGEVWHGEVRNRARDGSIFWSHTTIVPFLKPDGKPRQYMAIRADITDRKRAEEARAYLASVVESSDDAIVAKTLAGTITAWNPGATKLYGYSASEALGRSMRMLLPPERDEEETDILARLRRGESVKHFETVRVTKSGRRIDVSVTISPIRESRGEIIGASNVARDITDRKQAEEALRENHARLKKVLEIETVGVLFWDLTTGCLTEANDTFLNLMGYSRREVDSRELTWQKLTPPEYLEMSRVELKKFAASGRVGPYEKEYFRKDGTRQWLLFAGSSLGGNTCVEFCVDISDRKKAEAALRENEREIRKLNEELETRVVQRTAQLEEANRELEAFTYSVSHDLRAPLRHIGGFSRILIEDFGPELAPEARDHIQRIEDGVKRMGLLVDELLNLGRVGRHALKLQITDLNLIVEEVVSLLQPETARRIVTWKIASLPPANCDSILIRQVFQNFISNALKFTRPRQRADIEISCRDENGRLVIAVRDNGVGFNMKYADKLFGVFQRLHRGEDFEGTGIGLATVQRIIHKHGGRVWAEAEPDRGATFYFTIPSANTALSCSPGGIAQTVPTTPLDKSAIAGARI